MTQTKEQKAELAAAEKDAPSDEELRRLASTTPPLVRDEEHSFVPVEDTDREEDAELVQPDLTGTGMAPVQQDFAGESKTISITRPDRAKSTYERSTQFSETDVEFLSDEQIKDSGVLTKSTPRIHPARIAPSSDRPRQPGSTAPAAGAGSWPVHEGQLPAVMPSDPPLDEADDRHLGDNTFGKAAGFSRAKDGTLTRKGVKIEKDETAGAAALYLRLRQQFPSFTAEQLADEFELQWLSGRSGAEQSHRPGEELSQNGLTEVGDERVEQPSLGELRRDAPEADPEASPLPSTIDSGVPSENEPASSAPDQAKEPSGETVEADKEAAAAAAKFDHDGDGRPGGAPPGGNKKG